MALKLKCPGCMKVLQVPDSLAGRRGKCPACASLIQVPEVDIPVVQLAPAETQCPGCGGAIEIPESMIGKRVRCPACASEWRAGGAVVDAELDAPRPKPSHEWVDDPTTTEYRLAPTPAPSPMPRLPVPRRTFQSEPRRRDDTGFFAPERRGISKGVVGGLVMMAIAAVWLVGGLAVGILFYYPPVLFVIGLFALVKGIITGNFAGDD